MITNEFSTLSDLKWHERRIGDIIPYPIDKRFSVEPECWESIYPTRSNVNTIDYITIASTGNAIDYGDLIQTTSFPGAVSNGHGGLVSG